MGAKDLEKLATNIYRSAGDAISGERIIAQARTFGRSIIVPGTSKHRIQQATLRKNVFCVIDKAFRIREDKMRVKQESKRA